MKVEVQSKKGLRTSLSVVIDKKIIQSKLEERLVQLQSEVSLKGFRPGKVPPAVIKSQFGKAIYGEVIDKILKESTTKAIEEKKIKVAGQPRLDLKTFGEGKDLNYIIEVDSLPDIQIKSIDLTPVPKKLNGGELFNNEISLFTNSGILINTSS